MILFFVIGFLLLLGGLGYFFSNKVINHLVEDTDILFNIAINEEFVQPNIFESYNKTTFFVKSNYGYDLHCNYLKSKDQFSNKVIIFSHGVRANTSSSLKYAQFFLTEGYDVVLFDHRCHGKTGGRYLTYGFYEKHDLHSIVRIIKEKYGEDIEIGLHGESMGSAISIQYAGVYNELDYYIFDCPYSDLKKQLQFRLNKEYKLKGYLIMPLVDLFIKLRIGFRFKDVSPINFISKITKPILMIHTVDDDYIPSYMTQELFEKISSATSIYWAKNGGHAQAFLKNREEYISQVKNFLHNV